MVLRTAIWLTGIALTVGGCTHGATERGLPVDSTLLQAGDLVFRRGTSLASKAVLMADSAGVYSHVGIVVRHHGGWAVVHAVPGERDDNGPDTVKVERLTAFFMPSRAEHGAVARVAVDSGSLEQAANNALAFAAHRTAFDHDYNLSDSTAIYCTELAIRSYSAAGIDLFPARLRHVTTPGYNGDYAFPSHLLAHPLVKIIMSY